MIYNYPYSYFKRYRNYPYPHSPNFSNTSNFSSSPTPFLPSNHYAPKDSSCDNFQKSSVCNSSSTQNETKCRDDEELFEIFGIKLYFDDVLIVCLLFFLYQEGVKDYYLFISLILLLLS